MYLVILFTILNINGILLRQSSWVMSAGVEGSGQQPPSSSHMVGAGKVVLSGGLLDDEDSVNRPGGSGMPPPQSPSAPSSPSYDPAEASRQLGSGEVPADMDDNEYRSSKRPGAGRPLTAPITPVIVLPGGRSNASAPSTTTSMSSIISHTLIYQHPGQTLDPSKMNKKLDLNAMTSTFDNKHYLPTPMGPGMTIRQTTTMRRPSTTLSSSLAPDPISDNGVGSILGPKEDARTRTKAASFFSRPEVLATAIGGACITLLCAVLLILFVVYRLRKKDEGSYALDETKRALASHHHLSSGAGPPPPYGLGSMATGPGGAHSPYSRGGRAPPPVNTALLNKEFYA